MYANNFGEWVYNNIMNVSTMTAALFSQNPRISGYLNFNENKPPNASLQYFTGNFFFALVLQPLFLVGFSVC